MPYSTYFAKKETGSEDSAYSQRPVQCMLQISFLSVIAFHYSHTKTPASPPGLKSSKNLLSKSDFPCYDGGTAMIIYERIKLSHLIYNLILSWAAGGCQTVFRQSRISKSNKGVVRE